MAGALPTFIIIGAQKCGTTSLHTYLGLHPEIGVSREKELNFFLRPDGERDLDWYRSWFDPSKPVRGEASPGYTNHPLRQGVPERMHAVVPDARLIFVVRDPLKRALSQYRHYCADRREDRSAEEALGKPGSKYIVRSRYAFQLDRYLPIYPLERILVVQQERLLDRREETLSDIFRWLGVDPTFRSPLFGFRRHRSDRKRRRTDLGERIAASAPGRAVAGLPTPWRWMLEDVLYHPFSRPVPRPALSEALWTRLQAELRKDAERLREVTGQAFEGWSVWD
ncbi:MAG TPA: sulfotransferase [Longimicrobiales bacterium]|nr:sulfotransferase [Longimicrobiales bacterium]